MGEGFVSDGKPGKAGSHQAKPSTVREPGSHGDVRAGMGGGRTNLVESQKSNLGKSKIQPGHYSGGEMGWFLLVLATLPCARGQNEMGARAGLALGRTKPLLLLTAAPV